MSRLEIKGGGHRTIFGMEFILDGTPLRSIKEVNLKFGVDSVNEAVITFLVDDIKVDADVLLRLQAIVNEPK